MAWALCSVLLFSRYSNADVVSVPIGNGLTVSVMTGSNIPELQNIRTNPAARQVQLGDDGNVNVPLQFQFSYFGQTFSNSWMHSNGVVSFQNPSTTGNFCCSGVDLTRTTDSRYNYAIMPLWTDLYARTSASTYVLGTDTSVTYGWYGTSQYANSNNRSSFEVRLDSAGTVDMRWSGAVVSSAAVTMGFTGNLSRGEYYQNYHGNSVNIAGLGVSYTGARQPGPSTTPTTNSVTITPTTVVTTAPATPDTPAQTVNVGGVQLSTSGEISPPDNVPQALRDVQAVSRQAQSSAPSPSVMSVVSRIQANERATQALSIQNSNRASAQATAKSQEQSMAIVESLNSMSMESSQAAQANSAAQQMIQSISQSADIMGSSTVVSNYSMASAYVASRNAAVANDAESSMLPMPTPQSRGTSLTAMTEVRAIMESSQNESRTDSVKKDIQPNDLAGGVDIAAMATQPKGFDVYAMTVMQDSTFYTPKDIYSNQKTVDNARALRSLSSDRLHQEMVDQQYRR